MVLSRGVYKSKKSAMSQALYRKYRSKSLAEVVGQEHVTDVLSRSLQNNLITHAYLLTGPRGVGKTSIARILAHEINNLPYDGTEHLDIIEIDAASNNGVEDIRDLREKVTLAPISAQKKIYIIDEVHMLSKPAFNALLKTLEEPPEHVVFILATTEVHKLPDTILSRTQRFHFRMIQKDKMVAHLRSIAKQEKIEIEDAALDLIADRANGSFRDAISLLDQLRHSSNGKVTEKDVTASLGISDKETLNKLFAGLQKRDPQLILETLAALDDTGVSPVVLSDQINKRIKQESNLNIELIDLMDKLIEVGRSYDPQLKLFTILMSAAQSQQKKIVKTVSLSSPVASITGDIAAIKKFPQKQSKKEELDAKQTPDVAKDEVKKIANFDWSAALEYIRTNHLPLHSVVHKAEVLYKDGVVNLHFNYAIHKKKLDDGKYRQMLTSTFVDLYQTCPSITTSSGKLPPKNEQAKAVAAIMGGGEEVSL